jgi:hypothetical protein
MRERERERDEREINDPRRVMLGSIYSVKGIKCRRLINLNRTDLRVAEVDNEYENGKEIFFHGLNLKNIHV